MDRCRRAKWMLLMVAFGLFVSGVTIWPAQWELTRTVKLLWGQNEPTGQVHALMARTVEALKSVEATHPFLLYGYDWLAFAHILLAILFAGAARNPVRNVWIIQCGLIACVLIPVLAGICIPLRQLPFVWFWVDFAFAPAAALPLLIAWRDVKHAERRSTLLGLTSR